MTVIERFSAKWRLSPNGCWEWSANRTRDGYGVFRMGSRMVGSHRASWSLLRGPIPPGAWVLHHCDNRPCVNQDHLFLGDHTANMRDKAEKGRAPRGVNNAKARLTPGGVRRIRQMYRSEGVLMREIGDVFGISFQSVSRVLSGESWGHVPDDDQPEVTDAES